ncbi:MAG: hypothetical protein WCI52_02630 [bacterium]
MKYSPRQYAESLYDLTKDGESKNIKKFAEFLYANGESSLLPEISYQFTSIWKERNGITREIIETEDGIKIRENDLLVDNTISERINRLKEVINY